MTERGFASIEREFQPPPIWRQALVAAAFVFLPGLTAFLIALLWPDAGQALYPDFSRMDAAWQAARLATLVWIVGVFLAVGIYALIGEVRDMGRGE